MSFNRQSSTLDCLIRNLSDDGALILLSDAVALPAAFEFEIPNRNRGYQARVRWRDGERVGIAFETEGTGTTDVVPLDLVRRLKRCEENNVRLQSRIRQLTEAG